MRTEALETGRALCALPKTIKHTNLSGTWNRHTSTKKESAQESGVLKEDQLMMDSMLNGTDLLGDLNTPDIKFDMFDFQSNGATNSYTRGNVKVESSPASLDPSVEVVCRLDDDNLSVEAQKPGTAYALFDMSPGTRDLLQAVSPSSQEDLCADQHEQRINIEEYQLSLGTQNVNNDSAAYNEYTMQELDFLLPEESSMVEELAQDEIPVAYNSPSQLSIKEGDFDFSIPKEVLEAMDSLFPEEKIIESSVTQSNNVCTTELDMYLGQQEFNTDLLSQSLEQSGIFVDELESFVCEDTTKGVTLLPSTLFHNQTNITTQNIQPHQPQDLAQINIDAQVVEASSFIQDNFSTRYTSSSSSLSAIVQNQSTFSIPLPVNISSNGAAIPKTVVKKQQLHNNGKPLILNISSTTPITKTPGKKRQPQEDGTSSLRPVKRQRRTSRKPLRFREHYASSECFAELEDMHEFGPSTTDIENESAESCSNVTTRKGTKGCVKGLTEEEKYHRIRILNNEASKRCRLKRKITVKEMEVQLKELQERNLQLKEKHEALKQLKDKFQIFVTDYFKKCLTYKH